MKALFQLRVLLLLAIGFLSGCADEDAKVQNEDAKVQKKFEEDVMPKFMSTEIAKEVSWLKGISDWSYDVEKTDSLISPYVATINTSSPTGTETSFSLAYQDDKWIVTSFKQRNEKIGMKWMIVGKDNSDLAILNAFLK